MRLDKWLWAARFFKTRPLATEAVSGGKVRCNGQRAKPGKLINVGDELCVKRGGYSFEITVLAMNEKRRPASEARLLYSESESSIAAREKLAELQRLAASTQSVTDRKPDKHEREHIIRFKRNTE